MQNFFIISDRRLATFRYHCHEFMSIFFCNSRDILELLMKAVVTLTQTYLSLSPMTH